MNNEKYNKGDENHQNSHYLESKWLAETFCIFFCVFCICTSLFHKKLILLSTTNNIISLARG